MIREFGLSIKFRWSGGGEKMGKRLVRGLGRAENKKKWLSEASDEQKTEKTDFRPCPKSKKRQKQQFGHGRKLKNEKNYVSATAEKRKTAKTAFRPRPKLKKRLKMAFQPLGRAEN